MTTELLRDLSELAGVSGNEQEVRGYLANHLRGHVDELRSDAIGNLVAIKHPRLSVEGILPLKVMLTAHMDEVGLMITNVDSNGMLRFASVGGVDERVLPAKAVVVGKSKVPGVIGLKPVHLLKSEERKVVPDMDSLYIDIGASSKEEAERLVHIGDYASFPTKYLELGQTARGKAFDDRVGCAILAELLKGDYSFTLQVVFAAQEEVGLRGARTAAYRLMPDIAFAVEGTVCDDMPKKRDVSPTSVLGKGPAITIVDRSLVADKLLVELLLDTARSHGIPHQIKQPLVGATDAGAVQRVGEGIRSAVLAVPVRYIHSPVSIVSLVDFQNTRLLMEQALRRLSRDKAYVERILADKSPKSSSD